MHDDSKQLFYDTYSKRFFESTIYNVQHAEYELNRDLVLRDYAYLNEWYEALGIEHVENGWGLGWSTTSSFTLYWQSWLDFNHSKGITEDGRPYISIDFWQEPIPNFDEYF